MIEYCTQRAAGSVRQHRLECLLFVLGCLAAAAAGVLYLSVNRLLQPGGFFRAICPLCCRCTWRAPQWTATGFTSLCIPWLWQR